MLGTVTHLDNPTALDTLQWMARYALRGEESPQIRELAERIVGQLMGRDYPSEYTAVLNWVRANVRYTRDPQTIEQLALPEVTLAKGMGDCDDMATLIAAIVLQIGGRCRFVAASFGPGGLAHVWTEAWDPISGHWLVLDPVPGRRVGQMLAHTQVRVDVSIG